MDELERQSTEDHDPSSQPLRSADEPDNKSNEMRD